jgi:hypothetical protein
MKIKFLLSGYVGITLIVATAQHVASSASAEEIPPGQYRRNINTSPSLLPKTRTRRKRQWFDDDNEETGKNLSRFNIDNILFAKIYLMNAMHMVI